MNTAPDVDIYYEEFGAGVPIVFTSSGTASHAMWEQQIATFARDHHTITYDWRGTGSSSRPRTGYSADAAAHDLCALIEQLTSEPVILVGHGMGVHVSMLAAFEQPERVRGMLLADGAPWYSGQREGVEAGMSAEFLESSSSQSGLSYPDTLDRVVREWMFHEPPSDALRNAIVQDGLSWPLFVLDEYDRTMMELDHRTRLGDITWPTTIVHGRHDRKQNYAGGVYLAENIPGAEFVSLENSAHMGHLEETEKFDSALSNLLRASAR